MVIRFAKSPVHVTRHEDVHLVVPVGCAHQDGGLDSRVSALRSWAECALATVPLPAVLPGPAAAMMVWLVRREWGLAVCETPTYEGQQLAWAACVHGPHPPQPSPQRRASAFGQNARVHAQQQYWASQVPTEKNRQRRRMLRRRRGRQRRSSR